jgi:hypothetical protein
VLFTAEIIGPVASPYLGVTAFEAAHEQVRLALPPSVDSRLVTVQLWCAMHGLVTLRQARPTFPWPDLDYQIDDLVDRLIGSTP